MGDIREAVRNRYAGIALQMLEASPASCCADGGACECGDYDAAELATLGLTEGVSLGCGNPMLLAELHPGEDVLDLGSGAGLDVLLSARRVAPDGHAYGVDMTDEMLALAERNKQRAGVDNVSFLKGSIEALPLADASVDVVISNCVINLAEDKSAVLTEAFRVLRPGGRLTIADMVQVKALSVDAGQKLASWSACEAGAMPIDEYRDKLSMAGFDEADIEVHSLPRDGAVASAYIRARKPI